MRHFNAVLLTRCVTAAGGAGTKVQAHDRFGSCAADGAEPSGPDRADHATRRGLCDRCDVHLDQTGVAVPDGGDGPVHAADCGLGCLASVGTAIDAQRAASGRRATASPAGLLHHSDRGSQYDSGEYQAMIRQHGMIPSMSGKGNCYDNATMESFFHTLKVERVHRVRYE